MVDKLILVDFINYSLPVVYVFSVLVWLRIGFLKERYQALQRESEQQIKTSAKLKRSCDQYRFENEWHKVNTEERNSGKQSLELLKRWSPKPESFLGWIVYDNQDYDRASTYEYPKPLLKNFSCEASPMSLQRDQFPEAFSTLPDEIESLTFFRTHQNNNESNLIVVSDIPDCFQSQSEKEHLTTLIQQLKCQSRYVPPKLIQFESDVEEDIESIIAKEMLEIRSLLDLDFQSPEELMIGFLDKLTTLAGYTYASLYLHDENLTESGWYSHFASGGSLPVGCDDLKWREGEAAFVQNLSSQIAGQLIVTPESINEQESEILFRCGLILPVRQGGDMVGVIMLTHTDKNIPTQAGTHLVEWASQFLVKTLNREMTRIESLDQARRDGLTNLANRRTFDQELERFTRQAELSIEECSLVMIDIDHFKSINDQYGHQVGDEVLKKVAETMRTLTQNLRVTDYALAARYGGEEFALILPIVGQEGAVRIAEQLRQHIEEMNIRYENHSLSITASLGVSTTGIHGISSRELIQYADEALYAAKKSGRNCVCTTRQRFHGEVESGSLS